MSKNTSYAFLEQLIESEHIINPKIKVVGKNDKGEGYLGEISAIKIKGENKTLNLILKKAPKSENLRKQTPIREVFSIETNFYTRVYPTMRKFQLECGDVKPFLNIAKCFLTSDSLMEEMLVLQNLKEIGYSTYDRQKLMDENHIILVLEEYGRLHALSYALKDKNGELFRELTHNMKDAFLLFIETKEFKDLYNGILEKVLNIFEETNDNDILSALNKHHETYIKYFQSLTPNNADQYAVITHGDCWCNNIMFKYNDFQTPNIPTSMCLIDWQLQKLASPVTDLSYFLFTCAGKNIFDNLDKYLQIYHKSLSSQLLKLDCDPNNLLPFKVLQEQWKKFAKYGMSLAFIVIRIMLSDRDEVPDLVQAAENGENAMAAFDYKTKHEEQYKQRIRHVVVHCYENNII